MDTVYRAYYAQCCQQYFAAFRQKYTENQYASQSFLYDRMISPSGLPELHDPYITSLIHEFKESLKYLPDDCGVDIMNTEYILHADDMDDIVDKAYSSNIDHEHSSKKHKVIGQYECRKCGKKYVSTDGVRKHYKKAHGDPPTKGHIDEYCIRVE